MTRRYWLDLIEYIFLGGSVIGTIAAAATQQVIYAAVPLTITVGLNMDNRQRIHHLYQQQHNNSITNLKRLIEPLEEQIGQLEETALSAQDQSQDNVQEFKEAIAQVHKLINPMKNQLDQLKLQVDGVDDRTQKQMRELKEAQQQGTEAAFSHIDQSFSRIKEHLAQLELLAGQVDPTTQEKLQELQGSVAQIHEWVDPFQHQIETIENKIGQIHSETASQISQLQALIEGFEQKGHDQAQDRIEPLRAQIEEMKTLVTEQVNPKTTEQIEELRNAIAQLQEQTPVMVDSPYPDESSITADITTDVEETPLNIDPVPLETILPDSASIDQWSCKYTLTSHSRGVNSLAITRSGQNFASGSDDNTIKLWQLSTGQELRTMGYKGTRGVVSVKTVAISPNGDLLASGGEDKTIQLWELSTGKTVATLKGHSGSVKSLVFSPDGNTLISGSDDKTIKIWDLASKMVKLSLTGHSDWFTGVKAIAISPDGKYLASGSDDKAVKIWDLATGNNLKTLMGHHGTINDLAFTPDGKVVASASDDGIITLWDIETGKAIESLSGHNGTVYTVAFSPNGKLLASGSWDRSIKLWDWTTGQVLDTLNGHSAAVVALTFAQENYGNERHLALISGSSDNTVCVWSCARQ